MAWWLERRLGSDADLVRPVAAHRGRVHRAATDRASNPASQVVGRDLRAWHRHRCDPLPLAQVNPMLPNTNSARDILLSLGMGDFNATMVIPYLFWAPAQTDPQMGAIVMLTRHLQIMMRKMGAPLSVTGSIDANWAPYMAQVAGPHWMDKSWAEISRDLINARSSKRNLKPVGKAILVPQSALSGITDSLPQIPGGLFTYAVGGYLLWRHMRKA